MTEIYKQGGYRCRRRRRRRLSFLFVICHPVIPVNNIMVLTDASVFILNGKFCMINQNYALEICFAINF